MHNILITGGTGFLGRQVCKVLLDNNKDISIRTISRNENELVETLVLCTNDKRLDCIIGDIRSLKTIQYVLYGVDTILHLAAMKHIDFCEKNPREAILTNIIATMNLLEIFNGDTFIGMSTDKAVESTGCYGATKMLLEKVIIEKARKSRGGRYIVVRSGNMFNSTGSVIRKWIQQIKQDNKIVVTDTEMTRFFTPVDVLAQFISNTISTGKNGKIYIPKQQAIRLGNLIDGIMKIYGNSKTRIVISGLREGEKMHEMLFSPLEASEQYVITNLKINTSDKVDKVEPKVLESWIKQAVR